MIYKEEVNSPLTNSNISMINSDTDLLNNNFTMLLKTLEVIMPKQLLLKDSANSFQKKLQEENLLCDLLLT